MASLDDAFQQAAADQATGRVPSTVAATMDRFGWTTSDVADKFGVSQRTARRWRQENRVPTRGGKRESWRGEVRNEMRQRARRRMERRGITKFTIQGQYKISKRSWKTGPNSPIRNVMGKIPASAMRDYFAAIDQGDQAAALAALNAGIGEAYGAPGLEITDVESFTFTI